MERQAYVRDEREGGSRDPGGPRSRERSGSQGHAPASVRGAGEDRRYRGSKKSARGREMGARKRERGSASVSWSRTRPSHLVLTGESGRGKVAMLDNVDREV